QDNGMEDLIEEWDRHESLHDDVSARRVLSGDPDNVPGTKERTFEDEVEVTWDKGSSGLVFNTDASSFWKSAEAEAAEADDWDVDIQDYCSMRSFYKQANDSVFHRRKRIGRLLKKQGWAIGMAWGPGAARGFPSPLIIKGRLIDLDLALKPRLACPLWT
ncbi:G patch domain-containing protein 3, partial [Caligus rogercresseyi]